MEVVKQRKAGQDTAAEAKGVAGSLSVDRQDLRTSELTRLFTVGPVLHSVPFRKHTFTQKERKEHKATSLRDLSGSIVAARQCCNDWAAEFGSGMVWHVYSL